MHDIALLKRLNRDQVRYLIENDPFIMDRYLDARIFLEELAELKVDSEMTNKLLLSFAKQLEDHDPDTAFEFYGAYDARHGTKLARAYAIRIGSADLLSETDAEWFHYAEAASHALQRNHARYAFTCFTYIQRQAQIVFERIRNGDTVSEKEFAEARVMMRRGTNGIKTVLKFAIEHIVFEPGNDVMNDCLNSLDRVLTQNEILALRKAMVAISLCKLDYLSFIGFRMWFDFYASTSEKETILNHLASQNRLHRLRELAGEWKIPIKEHHLRAMLGRETDGTKRFELLRMLSVYSDKYDYMLHAELLTRRNYALTSEQGNLHDAEQFGEEAGQPLTLQEIMSFIRYYGTEHRHFDYATKMIVDQLCPEDNSSLSQEGPIETIPTP